MSLLWNPNRPRDLHFRGFAILCFKCKLLRVLSLIELGTNILHVKDIPDPGDLLSYFSVIYFGLKKIDPSVSQYRNKIKSIFNNISDEIIDQTLKNMRIFH